jgi:hypothetical protein
MEIALPIIYYLSFLGTKGSIIGISGTHPIFENELHFPKMIIETFDVVVEDKLKTRFDQLWNAFGMPRSLHYDKESKWIEDPR